MKKRVIIFTAAAAATAMAIGMPQEQDLPDASMMPVTDISAFQVTAEPPLTPLKDSESQQLEMMAEHVIRVPNAPAHTYPGF